MLATPARTVERQRGLSLAETAISAVILALVALVLLNLFPDSMALVSRSRQESLALYAAQNALEAAAAEPFDRLELGSFEIEPSKLPNGCSGEVVVSEVDGVPSTRIKSLRATVSFRTRSGRERKVSGELYVHAVRR